MKHFKTGFCRTLAVRENKKAYFREHDDNVAIFAERNVVIFAERDVAIFASFSGLKLQGPVGVRPVVHGGKVRHCVRVLALPVTVEHTVQVTLAHLVTKNRLFLLKGQ
jgi:hypothetical protein